MRRVRHLWQSRACWDWPNAHSQAKQTHRGSLVNSESGEGKKKGKQQCFPNRENGVFEVQSGEVFSS